MQDEEKRKILKMLISPNSERNPTKNINEFMSLADKTIKAAKSAENLSTSNQVKELEEKLQFERKVKTKDSMNCLVKQSWVKHLRG